MVVFIVKRLMWNIVFLVLVIFSSQITSGITIELHLLSDIINVNKNKKEVANVKHKTSSITANWSEWLIANETNYYKRLLWYAI
jgi:hypothetical protein